MTTETLIIAHTPFIGKILRESLYLIDVVTVNVLQTKNEWTEELCQMLRENKKINIIMADFNDDELSSWLWQIIRSEKDIQNPVIMLGLERETVFCSKHSVFRDGTAKYHRYLASPWEVENLQQILQEIKPLQGDDDEHREGIFKRFGDTDLYARIYRRLHGVKCLGGENELLLGEEVENLSRLLQDDDLHCLTQELVAALRNDELTSATVLKNKIEESIKNNQEV